MTLYRWMKKLQHYAVARNFYSQNHCFQVERIYYTMKITHYTLNISIERFLSPKISSKSKRLADGKVSFHQEHGCTGNLSFFGYVTTATIQHFIDTSNSRLWALRRGGVRRRVHIS